MQQLAEFINSEKTLNQFMDCRHEQTNTVSTGEINGKTLNWLGREINESDWLLELDDATLAELRAAAEFIKNHPVANMSRRPHDLKLDLSRAFFERLTNILDNGVGFAVIDRLPLDDYPLEVLVELYWVLGQLVARPVAQKRNGQMIYDVRDTKKKFDYGVRGSVTNVELNFHTDNAFGVRPPDYVGLFCRHPAKSGGISRFCSLYALHKRLQQESPAALARLYQPMLFDRQKEHLEGEPKVTLAPFFSSKDGRLRARANPSLVRAGYKVAEVEMDEALIDALDTIDRVSKEDEFWYEAALQQGQIQYLNNSEIGHYRSEFVDFDDEHKKRHLFRLWHRKTGSVSYDGGYSLTT